MPEIKDRGTTGTIPLNGCMAKTIGGTRYKVYSIYAGDGDFRHLYENFVAKKASRQQNGHCNDPEDAV